MRGLEAGYQVEIDRVGSQQWYRIIEDFYDANIYQTWAYDSVRCGENQLSHLLLKKDGLIVSAAQARIIRIPIINLDIAYIRWGPLWRLKNREWNNEIFRQAIRALRNEYICERRMALRIFPVLFDDDSTTFLPIFKEEGYRKVTGRRRDRTLIMDLSPSIEDLRKGLRQSWRRHLNQGDKGKLEIIDGHEDELFQKFIEIYQEMLNRKKFPEPNDITEFRRIQKYLPGNLKMKIMLCQSKGVLCAGLICSAIGDRGIYLFGATSNHGMESRGSYVLHWKLIEWLKKNGFSWYDLNGINPEKNPGTYQFKEGLCGKEGRDVYFLGQFDAYENTRSLFCFKCGDSLKETYRKMVKNYFKAKRMFYS
jgi:hypothetical protein